MQITLEIPDELATEAENRGVSVESYVKELVDVARKPRPEIKWRSLSLGPGPYTPEEAVRNIRELRKKNTLGGLKIRDLINEGRKY
jgi:hypothetical protein